MINKKNLIIYVLSGITLISFIGALSNTPAFLAIISYCLGIATPRETKKQDKYDI
jgi:hypothetical protein